MNKYVIGLSLLLLMLIVGILTASAQETPFPETPIPTTPDDVAGEIVGITTEVAETTAANVEGFLNRLLQVPQSDLMRVLLIVGGLILLLAGWRIYEVVIVIAGFVIGAAIASSLVVEQSTSINLIVLLIGGIIGAALSVLLYYVAVFLIGMYVGVALTNGLAGVLGLAPVTDLALLVGGIIGGIVLVILSFELLILISAVVGAQMLTLGLGLNATWTIILAIIGIIIQLGLTRALNYDFRRRPRRPSFFRRVTS